MHAFSNCGFRILADKNYRKKTGKKHMKNINLKKHYFSDSREKKKWGRRFFVKIGEKKEHFFYFFK